MCAIHTYSSNVLDSIEILRMKAIAKARNETFFKSSTPFHTMLVVNSNDSKKARSSYLFLFYAALSYPLLYCAVESLLTHTNYRISSISMYGNKPNILWNHFYTHTECRISSISTGVNTTYCRISSLFTQTVESLPYLRG